MRCHRDSPKNIWIFPPQQPIEKDPVNNHIISPYKHVTSKILYQVYVWIALKRKKICVWRFFCGSYTLFTGPANTESDKINFKIGSHGTIHTFKNYFATLFSTISCIQTNPYFAQKYHTFEPKFSQEIRVWSFGASSWAQNTSRIVFCAKTSRTYFLEKYSSFKSSFLCKIRGWICGASFELVLAEIENF